jgi:hypothetical protein
MLFNLFFIMLCTPYMLLQLVSTKTIFIFYQYMCNICVTLITDNTTTAGINYKQQYACKWNPMTLMNNKLYI